MLFLFEHILNPLLGMSLTAAFVAVVVILLRLILKKRAPKQVVCLLWLVVFARLLVPVMVESPFSLVPNALENIIQVEQNEMQNLPEPSAPVENTAPAPTNEPVIEITPAVAPGDPVQSQPVSDPTQDPAIEVPPVEDIPLVPEPSLMPEVPSAEEPVEKEPTGVPSVDIPLWMPVSSAVWVVGVAIMLVVGVGSYVKLRRRVYDAIRSEDGVWEHPSLASPFILGLIRPKIYLPMGIEGQPRMFILHHERAHLRRLDHVVKPICWFALALHWFNPLVWVAFMLMSRDIETACDESVIRQLGSEVKADYSATLLALATNKRFPAPSPLSFGEGDAKVRIKNVLSFKKPALWVTIAAVVVVIVAAACFLTDPADTGGNWVAPEWAAELREKDVESMSVSIWRDGENENTQTLPQEVQKELIGILNAVPRGGFKHSLNNLSRPITVEEWLKQAEFDETIPEGEVIRLAICRRDNEYHGVLTYQEGQVYLSVLVDQWESNGVPYLSSDRWTVDNASLTEFLTALAKPDLSAYTTMDDYPGLYFLEEPSSTVGTKITAYKLIDGELVLVGGYDEHMANNFHGLIGSDGEEQHIFASPDEVYAMFEELLTAALDPDWAPSAGEGNGETEVPDYELTIHWDTLKEYTYKGETYPMEPVALQLDLPQPITFERGALLDADREKIGYMALISVDENFELDETTITRLGMFAPDGTLTTHDGEGMTFSTPWIRAGYDAVAYTSGSGPDTLYAYIRVSPSFVFYLSLQGGEYLTNWERCLMTLQVESGITYDTSSMSLLASLPEHGLYLYKDKELLYPFLVYQGQQKQLNGTLIDPDFIEPGFYPADRNGDGIEEIVFRFNQGHGTGFMEDGLLACQLYNGQLMVNIHDWSGIARNFNANNSFTYDPQTRTLSLSYGGYTATVVCPEYADLTGCGSSAVITGDQVRYTANGDGSFTLSLIPAFSNGDPLVQHFNIDLQCTVRYDGDSFRVTEAPHLVCKDLRENSPPTGTIGDRFLAALNGSGRILSYGPSYADGQFNTTMDEILDDMLQITQIAIFDLDGDGTKELLLQLGTPSMEYGTEILRYNRDDGRIYGYMLWTRAFMDVKEDGTFSYSGGMSHNGFGQLSFTDIGAVTVSIADQQYGSYSVNGQSATESAYLAAIAAQQEKPNLIWTKYTPENAKTLIKEHFDVTNDGPASPQSFLTNLPFELVTPDTLPTDPEEYYLVAELPESHVYLYAKNHGEDSMLLWNGNFWWPLTGRTAHTPRMNLPRLYLMDENTQSTTVAAISERASGTEVSVEQLVVYVMGEHQVDSSYYTGLRQSVYDWSSVHEAFNKKNTLVYDADTNSFTVFWNGRVYNSGELPQDMGQWLSLEDGYTGSLFANGDITKFTYVGGNRFTVTVKTAVEDRPLSIGETGLDLNWTVEFNGEGFDLVGEINLGAEAGVNQSPSAVGSEHGVAKLPNGWKLNDFTIAGFDKDGLGDFGYRAALSEDELRLLPKLFDLSEWQELANSPEYGLTVCLALSDSDAGRFLYILDGVDGKAAIKLMDQDTGESFVYLASGECITYAKALAAVLQDRAA